MEATVAHEQLDLGLHCVEAQVAGDRLVGAAVDLEPGPERVGVVHVGDLPLTLHHPRSLLVDVGERELHQRRRGATGLRDDGLEVDRVLAELLTLVAPAGVDRWLPERKRVSVDLSVWPGSLDPPAADVLARVVATRNSGGWREVVEELHVGGVDHVGEVTLHLIERVAGVLVDLHLRVDGDEDLLGVDEDEDHRPREDGHQGDRD
jgi:hypothetical protein